MNTKKLSTKTITTAIAILIISSMMSMTSAQSQQQRLFNGNRENVSAVFGVI